MAFMNIVEHIRKVWGSRSLSPGDWAEDGNLDAVLQHLTLAAVAAGDQGFYTVLSSFYDRF